MKTHDNQKPFQCTVCNRGYSTAAALTSHMQNHHKRAAERANSPQISGPSYKCLQCTQIFRKPDELQVGYSTTTSVIFSLSRLLSTQHNNDKYKLRRISNVFGHILVITRLSPRYRPTSSAMEKEQSVFFSVHRNQDINISISIIGSVVS